LGRKKEYEAEILGKDNQTDLALLKIRLEGDEGLEYLSFADSDKARVGEWVLAVGNPYGLDGTVSFGVISAKGRNVMSHLLNEFIQTDAMIDSGSSGGPLVNLEGKVLGINSMAQGRGIGFTIPINTAKEVALKLKSIGRIERGWLGVAMQPMNRDLARNLGFPEATGVVVNGVYEDSPASRAGLQPGDAIISFDGHSVDAEKEEDLNEFRRLVAQTPAGRGVGIEVLRKGRRQTLRATVGLQPEMDPEEMDTELDFKVKSITPHMVRDYMLVQRSGVIVSFVQPGGYVASEAGLLPGDVLLSFGGQEVPDMEAFKAALSKNEKAPEILVRVQRGLDETFLVLKPGQVGSKDKGKEGSKP
jgi:serine protease Do